MRASGIGFLAGLTLLELILAFTKKVKVIEVKVDITINYIRYIYVLQLVVKNNCSRQYQKINFACKLNCTKVQLMSYSL